MKRARVPDGDDNSVEDTKETAAKRRPLPRAVPVTSTDLMAVRETYHTDCDIVAGAGPEPHRVFPVNRLVVGAWSEPFRVMVDGQFVEGQNRLITLPFEAPIVEIAVQHMYFLANLAAEPTIATGQALTVLKLAHLYDQPDLFEMATDSLMDSNTFVDYQRGDVTTLHTVLALGVDPELMAARTQRVKFPHFSIDVHDEAFKPFLTQVFSRSIPSRSIRLMTSEYTDEQRIANAYTVMLPEQFRELREKRTAEIQAGEDRRVTERYELMLFDMLGNAAATRCGIKTVQEMRENLRWDAGLGNLDDDMVEAIEEMVETADDTLLKAFYEESMRVMHPLPGMPDYDAEEEALIMQVQREMMLGHYE